jgi:hypothetical protein
MQEDEKWALSVDDNFEKFTNEKAQEIAKLLLTQIQNIKLLPEPRQSTLLNLIIGLRNHIQNFPHDLIKQLLIGIVNAMILVSPVIAPLTLETFDNIIDPLSDYHLRQVQKPNSQSTSEFHCSQTFFKDLLVALDEAGIGANCITIFLTTADQPNHWICQEIPGWTSAILGSIGHDTNLFTELEKFFLENYNKYGTREQLAALYGIEHPEFLEHHWDKVRRLRNSFKSLIIP